MKYEVGRGHEFFNEVGIADIALVDFDLIFDVGDVGGRARGHVVEDRDLVALGKECITEVRTDETGSTGDENTHVGKSNGVGEHLWGLALGYRPVSSQGGGAFFSYENRWELSKVFGCGYRLGCLVDGYRSGAHLGVAVNDYEP